MLFPGKDRFNPKMNNEYFQFNIGFAATQQEIQDYIESNVAVRDKLSVRGREVFHGSQKVGQFKQNGVYPVDGELFVAGIERYPVKEEYSSRYCNSARGRGWFYFVVVEGWVAKDR